MFVKKINFIKRGETRHQGGVWIVDVFCFGQKPVISRFSVMIAEKKNAGALFRRRFQNLALGTLYRVTKQTL